jgi:translocator protein
MRRKQWIVLLVTLFCLFAIYWINAGNTSLKPTGEVAGREEQINYTLPPGFIFSIWGLIYTGFLAYAVYGIKKGAQNNRYLQQTAWPFIISIVLNLVWTVIVGLDLWTAAFPVQWVMLFLSIYLLKQWEVQKSNITPFQKWMSIPFALYAGWLTVAIIPFTADLLNEAGWDGGPLSRETWGVVLYLLATVIIVLAYRALKQPFFMLPLVWVFFGFVVRFTGLPQVVAGILGALLLVYFITQAVRFFGVQKPVPAKG